MVAFLAGAATCLMVHNPRKSSLALLAAVWTACVMAISAQEDPKIYPNADVTRPMLPGICPYGIHPNAEGFS